MREPMPPCLGCTKRYIGCHSDCKDYLEYRELLTEYKQAVKKAKQLDEEMDEVVKKRFEKYIKNKERHQKGGAYN